MIYDFYRKCIKLTSPALLLVEGPGWPVWSLTPLEVAFALACRVSPTFLSMGLGGIESLSVGIGIKV